MEQNMKTIEITEMPEYQCFTHCKWCGENIKESLSNIAFKWTIDGVKGDNLYDTVDFLFAEHKKCAANHRSNTSWIPFSKESLRILLNMTETVNGEHEVPILFAICNEYNLLSSDEDYPII